MLFPRPLPREIFYNRILLLEGREYEKITNAQGKNFNSPRISDKNT